MIFLMLSRIRNYFKYIYKNSFVYVFFNINIYEPLVFSSYEFMFVSMKNESASL
jgi:hypothetical protein